MATEAERIPDSRQERSEDVRRYRLDASAVRKLAFPGNAYYDIDATPKEVLGLLQADGISEGLSPEYSKEQFTVTTGDYGIIRTDFTVEEIYQMEDGIWRAQITTTIMESFMSFASFLGRRRTGSERSRWHLHCWMVCFRNQRRRSRFLPHRFWMRWRRVRRHRRVAHIPIPHGPEGIWSCGCVRCRKKACRGSLHPLLLVLESASDAIWKTPRPITGDDFRLVKRMVY